VAAAPATVLSGVLERVSVRESPPPEASWSGFGGAWGLGLTALGKPYRMVSARAASEPVASVAPLDPLRGASLTSSAAAAAAAAAVAAAAAAVHFRFRGADGSEAEAEAEMPSNPTDLGRCVAGPVPRRIPDSEGSDDDGSGAAWSSALS
jgi:hypothetical protein